MMNFNQCLQKGKTKQVKVNKIRASSILKSSKHTILQK